MKTTTCTRFLEFDAAHRVLRHESKCATLHGHRYKVSITCQAPELDDVGRVVDFGVVKAKVGAWIDEHWDHTTLVNSQDTALLDFCWGQTRDGNTNKPPYTFPCEPTAENMAGYLMAKAQELLGDGLWVSHVRVWETPNCHADATCDAPGDAGLGPGFAKTLGPDTVPEAT